MISPIDHKLSKRSERVFWSEIISYLPGYLLSIQNWGSKINMDSWVDLMAVVSSIPGEANDF